MRSLSWIIILFALAAGIAVLANNYSGTAHIVVGDILYSMSLNTLIGGMLLLWLVLYVLLKLVRTIIGMPGGFRLMNKRYNLRKVDQELNGAGMAFFEGRYQAVQQFARKLSGNKEVGEKLPLALIFAAYAAQESGNAAERDYFLAELGKQSAKYQLPRHLLLAEDALTKSDYAVAAAHLQSAQKISPDLTQIVKLDLRRAIDQQDAAVILKHSVRLQKNGAISPKEAFAARQLAYRKMLSDAVDAKSMKRCLKKIPDEEKNGQLAVEIVQKYSDNGQFKEAVAKIKKLYPFDKNAGLLEVLGEVFPYLNENEQRKTLEDAEEWLKDMPRDEHLLYVLGRMAYVKQLWGKAQSYFEAALSVRETVAVRLALSKVFADTGKEGEAEKQRNLALNMMAAAEEDEDEA